MYDVLISGAGPTGLVLALWLTKQGIRVRIIDKSVGPGETSRAMAVQARTLELYSQLGLSEKIVEEGHKNPTMNLWVRGKRRAGVSFGDAGHDVTPFPFVLVYPQDAHEKLLIKKLSELGIHVERQTELTAVSDTGETITARLTLPDGSDGVCEARYLAACDGARSTIRHQLGIDFQGGTYDKLFYVADVKLTGLEPANEAHIALDGDDFVVTLAYGRNGRRRLIGTVQADGSDRERTLTFEDVGHRALQSLKARVKKIYWFSTYRVHHRVADRFRQGRIFLLGDAAHVHSPAGGQGMNTGIQDAINLAWKLTAVIKERAPDSLLDSYGQERRAFALKLVSTTDRLFTLITQEGELATQLKTWALPLFTRLAYRIGSVRKLLFRLISQTLLDYHDSPLSRGVAGKISGGDRLPWLAAEGYNNYLSLREITWQVHVTGAASNELAEWCDRRSIPLRAIEWKDAYHKHGFTENAAYVIRPDTWVGLVSLQATPAALEHYFTELGYTPGEKKS